MALRRALLLGLVQGPTEVLPVSSSAHVALLARAAGKLDVWEEPELRNSLEVALHAGAAAALLVVLRGELAEGVRELNSQQRLGAAALSLTPPALVGYLLEQRLERRAGRPRTVAAGLALGGAAMAWADAGPVTRRLADLKPGDGLALGIAQALALFPGVSRNGATLTAARARGFTREDAHALSWRAGLPVLAGAMALKAYRIGRSRGTLAVDARDRVGRNNAQSGLSLVLAAGAGAAFLSTLACAPLLGRGPRGRPLWPFALYRTALGVLVWRSSGSA
ncbi:MAG TPA: undecaprenyl-diphosphate phosphatase [Solirubrobacteraceae bacterium]|nr:undecaprenyl-diphosphate phosphatase [Solirubrobacteraceae bacterium]